MTDYRTVYVETKTLTKLCTQFFIGTAQLGKQNCKKNIANCKTSTLMNTIKKADYLYNYYVPK